VLDVQLLLAPVSPDQPCGEDLEYDAAYLALERSAVGQPERQMGDAILPAEDPDWRDVREQANALLARSKDLRIVQYVVQSSLALDGLAGLAQSLELIRQLVVQYWDGLFPLLDADDDNDPTFRINALAGLAAESNLRLIREAEFIRSRAFGPITLKAALNASGLHAFSSEQLSAEQLGGAFRDCEAERLASVRETLTQAQSCAAQIESEISERVGSVQGLDLLPLRQLLKQALLILNEQSPAGADATSDFSDAPPSAGQQGQGEPAMARVSGEVRSREDVLRALDRIIEYYARQEPSSPLPVLLSRARGLVDADFATIVRNLIPDGYSQFENLRGPDSY
jgi:type VI secretion system protein ImpA